MSELKPLVEGESDEVLLRILRSADDDVPGDEGRDRTVAALGLGAAPLGATTGTVIGAAKALGLTGWKVVAGVAVLVVTLGGGILARSSDHRAPVTPPIQTASTEGRPPASPTEAAPAPPQPTPSTIPATTTASPVKEHVEPSPTASIASAAKPAAQTTLRMELAALDEARSTLARRDAAGALALLDRYERDSARPQLADEATMLRIEALHAKGDVAAARALARRFLATHAGTTYEDRARSLLGPEL